MKNKHRAVKRNRAMRSNTFHSRTGWLLAGLLFVSMGCSQEEAAELPEKIIRPVKVMVVSPNDSMQSKVFSGVAKGIEEITLSFRVSGVLRTLSAKVGDKKKKGKRLASLDQSDFVFEVRNNEGQLKTAEAELEVLKRGERSENILKIQAQLLSLKSTLKTAEDEYLRVQQLYANDAASKARLDKARSELDLAKANLKAEQQELVIATKGAREEDIRAQEAKILSIRAKLDRAIADREYTSLYMPFDGVIAKKHVSNFEQIRKNQNIYDVSAMDRIEVKISIPDVMIANIVKGQSVEAIFLPLKGKKFSGKITKVGLSAESTTLTYPVWVEFKNPKRVILPGMPVEVTLKLPNRNGQNPMLPIDTVLEDKVSGKKYVWTFAKSSKTAVRKTIDVGDLVGDLIEVTSGLESGDVIIVAGLDQLGEGMEVRPLDSSQ